MRIGFHALSHLRLLPPRCHSIWKCWRKEEKRNTHTTEIRKEKERRKNLMTLNGAGLWIFLIPCTAILYSFVSRHGITHTHTIECAYSVCVCVWGCLYRRNLWSCDVTAQLHHSILQCGFHSRWRKEPNVNSERICIAPVHGWQLAIPLTLSHLGRVCCQHRGWGDAMKKGRNCNNNNRIQSTKSFRREREAVGCGGRVQTGTGNEPQFHHHPQGM